MNSLTTVPLVINSNGMQHKLIEASVTVITPPAENDLTEAIIGLMHLQQEAFSNQIAAIDTNLAVIAWGLAASGFLVGLAGAIVGWLGFNNIKQAARDRAAEIAREIYEKKDEDAQERTNLSQTKPVVSAPEGRSAKIKVSEKIPSWVEKK